MNSADMATNLIFRAKNLNEFTVTTTVPENFRFNGLVPFDMSIKKGEIEASHKQLIATEITVVIEGEIRLGNSVFSRGDVISILPHEVADFESLTDSSLVCIKFPSIPNDKVIVNESN
jgi:quercetin dioxygenase-like cupin family protein